VRVWGIGKHQIPVFSHRRSGFRPTARNRAVQGFVGLKPDLQEMATCKGFASCTISPHPSPAPAGGGERAPSFPRRRESTSRKSKAKLQGLGISGVDASLRWHDGGIDSRFHGNDETQMRCLCGRAFTIRLLCRFDSANRHRIWPFLVSFSLLIFL
jgi:hypothetical protein